jgi:NAD(P)-dependent dehydrogenase (short-subunit alcohol dehydrogenase family)
VVGIAGAVPAAARGQALDLAPLRVNCIAPGITDTEMFSVSSCEKSKGLSQRSIQGMPENEHKQFRTKHVEKQLVKHVATADEIADGGQYCLYFCHLLMTIL